VLAGAAEGGTNCREVLEAPKENRGEMDDVLDDEDDMEGGEETETEEVEEPNTVGRLGREDGSVLWQDLIVKRINNANP
jgi:hypothetical protein